MRAAIDDDPQQDRVIRTGFSGELDVLRATARDARQVLAQIEQRERERTGIKSLKIGYNRVFGYYIEVSKANAELVPEDYQRKQTLVGGERYTTAGVAGARIPGPAREGATRGAGGAAAEAGLRASGCGRLAHPGDSGGGCLDRRVLLPRRGRRDQRLCAPRR